MVSRTIAALVIGAAFLFGQNFIAYSAKGDAPMTVEGSVSNVTENLLTLDPEGIFSNELNLEVDRDTEFEALSSLNDLKKGDEIKVEYYEQDGKNIASHIMKVPQAEKEGGAETKT